MAACTASYLWIFFYRPVAFKFSIAELKAMVWYKRLFCSVYMIIAVLGLGLMFVNGIEAALWWAPTTTVKVGGDEHTVVWMIAVTIGMFSAQFLMCRMGEIAQKISATNNET